MSSQHSAPDANTDTSVIVRITLRDLQWLVFAVRNVQTRNAGEAAMRGELVARFDEMIERAEAEMYEQFAPAFTPPQARLCAWAANEGRCRDSEEMLTRGRMQRTFNEACGINGVNGMV